MLNHRELEKLKDKWWNIHRKCDKEDDQSAGISIRNIGGVFIVIFVGIGLACVALVVEYYYYRDRSRVQKIERKKSDRESISKSQNASNRASVLFEINQTRRF